MVGAIPRAALAQIDITGEWAPLVHEDPLERRGSAPLPADFTGLPLSEGARQWALSWDASRLSVLQHQCQAHALPYMLSAPTLLRIVAERDLNSQRVLAYAQYLAEGGQQRRIWVDGRAGPPDVAPHSWMGFSSGVWEGNTLVVRTTHIKQGWIRRNGVPHSDRVTTTERFTRHGDMLTYVIYIQDPVYLSEPIVSSRSFVKMVGINEGHWIFWTPCEAAEETTGPPHTVPHYLPGENPFVAERSERTGLPTEALFGGPETIYPEYRLKLKRLIKRAD
jgi:hypothetical protein